MADEFLRLSAGDQRDILATAAAELGKDSRVLEKDVWVVWCLKVVFGISEIRDQMAFKGGTALSKIHGVIQRFSEDVDLTLTYRSLVSEEEVAAATSGTRRKKLGERLRAAAIQQVEEIVRPVVEAELTAVLGDRGRIAVEAGGEALRMLYPSALDLPGPAYLSEGVLLEFGGRNVTEPAENHVVRADLASWLDSVIFPEASVRALSPARTFWEKVTLIHAELGRPSARADTTRRSRHLYDLVRMLDHDVGRDALERRDLLEDVVRIKETFFYTAWANYPACLTGGIRLLPNEEQTAHLRADYEAMLAAGMLYGEPPSFDGMLEKLAELEGVLRARG